MNLPMRSHRSSTSPEQRSSIFGLLALLALFLYAPAPVFAQADHPSAGKSVKVGEGVYEIVVHDATGTVYASTVGPRGENDSRVYALDGETLETVGTIPVGEFSAFGLGIHNPSGTLYATDTRSGNVLVMDAATLTMTGSIANPDDESGHLREVVTDPESHRVYVSSYNENGMIWVIDGVTGTVVDTWHDVGDGTSGMALDATNGRLFATNISGGDIAVLDVASGTVTRRFSAGGDSPTNIAYDTSLGRLWVANQGSNNATVLDAETGELIKAVPTGEQALGVTFNPVNQMVYVTNRSSGTVTVVDAASMEVVTRLQTGSHPNTVAVNIDTGDAYVTNKASRSGDQETPEEDPHGDTVTILRR